MVPVEITAAELTQILSHLVLGVGDNEICSEYVRSYSITLTVLTIQTAQRMQSMTALHILALAQFAIAAYTAVVLALPCFYTLYPPHTCIPHVPHHETDSTRKNHQT